MAPLLSPAEQQRVAALVVGAWIAALGCRRVVVAVALCFAAGAFMATFRARAAWRCCRLPPARGAVVLDRRGRPRRGRDMSDGGGHGLGLRGRWRRGGARAAFDRPSSLAPGRGGAAARAADLAALAPARWPRSPAGSPRARPLPASTPTQVSPSCRPAVSPRRRRRRRWPGPSPGPPARAHVGAAPGAAGPAGLIRPGGSASGSSVTEAIGSESGKVSDGPTRPRLTHVRWLLSVGVGEQIRSRRGARRAGRQHVRRLRLGVGDQRRTVAEARGGGAGGGATACGGAERCTGGAGARTTGRGVRMAGARAAADARDRGCRSGRPSGRCGQRWRQRGQRWRQRGRASERQSARRESSADHRRTEALRGCGQSRREARRRRLEAGRRRLEAGGRGREPRRGQLGAGRGAFRSP